MMKSSLIPEKPLLVYSSLASTVGLEESVMLSVLSELVSNLTPEQNVVHNNGFNWATLSTQSLSDAMPFWDARDIQRVSANLREKGVLLIGSAPFGETNNFKFAFNERINPIKNTPKQVQAPAAPIMHNPPQDIFEKAIQTTPFSKHHLAPNWQPSEDTLSQFAQYNISPAFALEHLSSFIHYWRERKETQTSWGSKFIQHVLLKRRTLEKEQREEAQNTAIGSNWRPNPEAMDILIQQKQVNPQFIEDAIPEFILYWKDRGDRSKTWNTKFIQHVRIQWLKYTSALEHGTDPMPIPHNWQPSRDVYDVLRLANIAIPFAQKLLPEFVLYWKDSNQLNTSWNTRFLQHVKKYWANQHNFGQHSSTNAALNKNPNGKRSTRELSLHEELNDTSWAN